MLLICQQIEGTPEDLAKLQATGSFTSVTELTPGSLETAEATQKKLTELAKAGEKRAKRNARISAAVAVGSLLLGIAGFAYNYYRGRAHQA